MTKNIQLPCGLGKDGKLVYIEEAENGLNCGCVCPGCGQPLVAKNNGRKKEHHFAHFRTAECAHGYQSALHYMAKDVFLEMKEFTFVKSGTPVKYRIDDVVLEKAVDSVIPDILVTSDGKKFIVEIFVTHAVDEEKKEKIKSLKISALEIDLSRFRHVMLDKDALKSEANNADNFSWVYDADANLIEEKRNALSRFGLKITIGIGGICPLSVSLESGESVSSMRSAVFLQILPALLFRRQARFHRLCKNSSFPAQPKGKKQIFGTYFCK